MYTEYKGTVNDITSHEYLHPLQTTGYVHYIGRILNRDSFFRLDDVTHWRRMITECKGLAKTKVPVPAQDFLRDSIRDLIVESTEAGSSKGLLAAQRELQWVVKHALWHCNCTPKMMLQTCTDMIGRVECFQVLDQNFPPQPKGQTEMRGFYHLPDDEVSAADLVPMQPPMLSPQRPSDVYHVQTSSSLRLEPGAGSNGKISDNLRKFRSERNLQLGAEPNFAEDLHKNFKFWTSGSGGGSVLKVYSQRRPNMAAVRAHLDLLAGLKEMCVAAEAAEKALLEQAEKGMMTKLETGCCEETGCEEGEAEAKPWTGWGAAPATEEEDTTESCGGSDVDCRESVQEESGEVRDEDNVGSEAVEGGSIADELKYQWAGNTDDEREGQYIGISDREGVLVFKNRCEQKLWLHVEVE